MKKIIITGGPTNESIDEVMKITNMSTGSLAVTLGEMFIDAGYEVVLILNNSVNADKIAGRAGLKITRVESTDDMLKALEAESRAGHTDIVLHAAAVGDYKAEYTFLMEDLAKYLYAELEAGKITGEEELLKLMLCKEKYCIDNSSKISSYQENLTVKLGLTPKIIKNLRGWYPDAKLIGCKLLENVSKEELYSVAAALCRKNDMDYILANDLADLRKGISTRHLVTSEGFTGIYLNEPKNIFEFTDKL